MDQNDNLPANISQRREAAVIQHPIPIFDTAKFEHFQRVATLMASASLIPEHLQVYRDRHGKVVRPNDSGAEFDPRSTVGNCLMIVNQAEKWRVDPFSLAQETFRTPGGQMGYGGKAVAAALYSVHGIKLDVQFTGERGKPERGIVLSGPRPGDGEIVTIDGTVAKWQTKNKDGSVKQNWQTQPDDQLIYRGTRQWCRRYAPEVILGVVTDEDIDEMSEYVRASRATPIQQPSTSRLLERLREGPTSGEGFSLAVAELAGEASSGATGAQSHPDQAGTMDDTHNGGNHEVSEQPSEPDTNTSDGSVSDSSQNSQSVTDKPASESVPPPSPDAGTNSDSSQVVLPETKVESASTSSASDADSDESKLRSFSDHLFQTTTGGPNALREPAGAWRKANGGWPDATNKVLSKKVNQIYAHHSNRVVGQIDEDACRERVEKEITR